jgi:glycerophosphoryl diester phosphodiesterase
MPEIIAHRGASRECLENTLAAFDRAIEQQADGIELDVHATSDGVVVVHHDPFVRDSREGQADRKLFIADVPFAELATLRLLNFEPVPTLDTVLARIGTQAVVYVEVKGLGIEAPVAACLRRHPETRTAVHAFDHRIPLAVARLLPGLPTGILSESYVLDTEHMIRAAGARDLWQQRAMIDRALVECARLAGARVVGWTENDVAHARGLIAMGVAALCTDIPGSMRQSLAKAGLGGL